MAALLFCTPSIGSVDLSIINGHIVVQDGHLLTVDLPVGFSNKLCRLANIIAELCSYKYSRASLISRRSQHLP